jgi:biotin--protein ligase
LLASWDEIITKEGDEEYIKGGHDTFHLEKQESRWSLHSLGNSLHPSDESEQTAGDEKTVDGSRDRMVDYDTLIKKVIPHELEWPGSKETPYFNHHSFYSNLKKYQEESNGEAEDFGKYILYGEVVTSTSTLLEK